MYVELHCHSGYSFLDGASHPEELVLQAKDLGYSALALTDHNGLYGSMEFAQLAKSVGLQPITGAEVTLEDGSHLTLLAETPTGYANLCRLISEAHLASPRGDPRLRIASLLERAEGLIVLSGCRQGALVRQLEAGSDEAEAFARRLRDVFGPGGFFIELQENLVKGDAGRNRALARLAERLGIPMVATSDVHYHRRERHRLQDVLVAIRHRTTLDNAHAVRRPNSEFYLAAPEALARRFATRPDALRNTLGIAERCAAFDLTRDLGYEFPDFEGSGRGTAIETLAAVCGAALEERYPPGSPHRAEAVARLAEELRLVERHGLAGFFLVYRDLLELAKEVAAETRSGQPRAASNLPSGRGRGSSVSSIICYLIGLSHIDPVANGLFLGRFLNEALATVPDIDLDFARDIREKLILRVYEKYGSEHAALVCSFPTYRLRSTVREVGKALDLPAGELEKLAKLAESYSAAGLKEEIERLPGFQGRTDAPLWRELVALAEEIAGLPRHISQHVGGMIISSRPLVELVPVEPAAMEGRVLCQWDKDSCDDAGFIKIDFLALGMLSLVEAAVDLIAVHTGSPPDLSRIDFQDKAVYDRICSGDTVGIFQIESRAQIQMLRRTKPRSLEELAIQVAIVRPGPIVGGAVNPYVRRREKLRTDPSFQIPYDHPCLEEALRDTLGVILYQDQVLMVCKAMAGFTDGQAEGLRRVMSRKRSREAMEGYWTLFRDGAARNGVGEATARRVFEQVTAFSEFGFPKSHAAAFGLLAYQSAWLRHYHPPEYYCALFNNQPMGFYPVDALVRDARRNRIEVRLPDVNASRTFCTVEGTRVRIGLGFVRDWGQEIADAVVAERGKSGPYRSLPDFLRRTPADLKRPAIENLIWVGGFDALSLTRRELLWQAGLWLGPEEEGRDGGRADDHQLDLELGAPYAELPFPDLNLQERMIAEYRMLHFSASRHPFALLEGELSPGTVSSDRLPDLLQHARVQVAGLVVARQRPETAKGYVFVLLEDEAGHVNVIVKPKVYERDRAAVRMEPFLGVTGRLQKDGDTINVIAHEVVPLRLRSGTRPEAHAPEAHHDPLALLTALRRSPPGIKSFG
ncbi:MAG: error-prone DNA polymerase [Gemmatimonadetes bacterium]|nr:error-prone DNA polymerase [Gemmatimonadota bacterium]